MTRRQRVDSGTEWEATVGYSRAVRAGDTVHVSGTTATDESGQPTGGPPREQARQALADVVAALEAVGASAEDVVRTRMYVTDIEAWEGVGEAHGEVFGDVRPATTMVEVSGLIDPGLCVEIEAVAQVDTAPEA